jgi:hypothetical protein
VLTFFNSGPLRHYDLMKCYSRYIKYNINIFCVKGKGKVHHTTGYEGPEVEYRYSSILSLTLALDGSWWSTPRPGRFTPGKDPVPIV